MDLPMVQGGPSSLPPCRCPLLLRGMQEKGRKAAQNMTLYELWLETRLGKVPDQALPPKAFLLSEVVSRGMLQPTQMQQG